MLRVIKISLVVIWLVVANFVGMIVDMVRSWFSSIFTFTPDRDEMLARLSEAKTFEEWQGIAGNLDVLSGNDLWRQNPMSKVYDYKLIASRFRHLIASRKSGNYEQVAELVRSGSLRNLASICEIDLYNCAYAGTKYLIEDYITEVIHCLQDLADASFERSSSWDHQRRLDYFHDTKRSYGTTSLVLHGGSLFGLCHLGTVKALLSAGLLPNVITGATVGAIVAAFVCSVPAEELLDTIKNLTDELPAIPSDYGKSRFGSVVEAVIRSRYPPEVLLFEQCVYDKLGDMTFEDAFRISGRALNIVVMSTDQSIHPDKGPQRLLNYLTTPKVIIRTAVRASIGTNILRRTENVQIMAKDYNGDTIPFLYRKLHYMPANSATHTSPRDSPYNRLSELFNVNNYIVSVTRPYFAPVLLSDFKHRGESRWLHPAIRLGRTIVQYRVAQMAELGLFPQSMRSLFLDENIPGGFQVNVVPEQGSILQNYAMLVDSQNLKGKVEHWIRIGEQSVWPMIAVIWSRTAIEHTLDSIYTSLVNGER
ncbi:Lipase 3 [Wickerhamiella sorbophila]|uniref:Lipase 3 n=1 Tax=Wickerhamiella sorbophila TaxID=45607 RepID=A0A2T0FPR0_9ASCO|nr:Lipase 3 [Wickerhamiella sorbophila]PRT56983.1 Lipase 3 [Wickerhamiella sorbophila]